MLSQRIRQLRTAQNISQVELAKRLGVSKQSVSNWENDNILPSIEMLLKLSDVFHTSTDDLLGRRHGRHLDITGLTDSAAAHLQLLVDDLRKGGKPDKDS